MSCNYKYDYWMENKPAVFFQQGKEQVSKRLPQNGGEKNKGDQFLFRSPIRVDG